MSSIIIGTGFGDEGKGQTVHNHIRNHISNGIDSNIVVRFNGGQQAGHTVKDETADRTHIFSSFGSGTLLGAATYWSHYCTLCPLAWLKEYNQLPFKPVFICHPLTMITTPYDIEIDRYNHNGMTVGTGFGNTVFRHEDMTHACRIYAKDLKYPTILKQKLFAIKQLYNQHDFVLDVNVDRFIDICTHVSKLIEISDYSILKDYDEVTYEGAQGIMLDREYGVFPYMTRSKTTCRNAIEIHSKIPTWYAIDDIVYVSRLFTTRHGKGPLEFLNAVNMNEYFDMSEETNVTNEYQGSFRTAPLNLDQLKYAMESNEADWRMQCQDLPYRQLKLTWYTKIKTSKIPVISNEQIVYMSADEIRDTIRGFGLIDSIEFV